MQICLTCKAPQNGQRCEKCRRALTPLPGLAEYTAAELIGEGGQGKVYKCRHAHDTRAIKIVDPRLLDAQGERDARDWFAREVRALELLDHPHVIALHGSGEVNGLLFLVTAYVPRTLREATQRGEAMPLGKAVRIAAELADALTYLHDQGVLHRDLKPANIGLDRHERVQVFDFGLAGFNGGSGLTTRVGRPALPFAAPEQFVGEQTGPYTDIYAFGAVLFELLTGRSHRPQAVGRFKDFHGYFSQPIPALPADPARPPLVEEIIRRCLAVEPAERFAQTWQLQAALADLAERLATNFGERYAEWDRLRTALPALREERERLETEVAADREALAGQAERIAEVRRELEALTKRQQAARREVEGVEAAARRARQELVAAEERLRAAELAQAEARDGAKAEAARAREAEARARAAEARERTAAARARTAVAAQRAADESAAALRAGVRRTEAEALEAARLAGERARHARGEEEALRAEIGALEERREEAELALAQRRPAAPIVASGLLALIVGGFGGWMARGPGGAPGAALDAGVASVRSGVPATVAPATVATDPPPPDPIALVVPGMKAPVAALPVAEGLRLEAPIESDGLAPEGREGWSVPKDAVLHACDGVALRAADDLVRCVRAAKAGAGGPPRIAVALSRPGAARADEVVRVFWAPPALNAGDQVAPGTAMRPALHFIPAGTFMMGSPPGEDGREDDEAQHEVSLSEPFVMMRTEVTQGQWKAVMGTAPAHFKACGSSCPVESVNWWEALAYANALSKAEGLSACYALTGCDAKQPGEGMECEAAKWVDGCSSYRLPTEAEWEYAARAGTTGAVYTGKLTLKGRNHGPELDALGWYGGNSGVSYDGGYDCSPGKLLWQEKQYPDQTTCGTHPAAEKQANAWSLHDMLGNVYEWCWDWSATYPEGSQSPRGPEGGQGRVVRGGSWTSYARWVRTAHRGRGLPGGRDRGLGFRLVRRP